MENVLPAVVTLSSNRDRYQISLSRLEYILKLTNCELYNFAIVDWNLVIDDWEKNVPYFFKNKTSLIAWIALFLYSNENLSGFSGSNFIFKDIKKKVIIGGIGLFAENRNNVSIKKEPFAHDIYGDSAYLLKLELFIDRNQKVDISQINLDLEKFKDYGIIIKDDGTIRINRSTLIDVLSQNLKVDSELIRVIQQLDTHVNNIEQNLKKQLQSAGEDLEYFGINKDHFVEFVKVSYVTFLLSSSENETPDRFLYVPGKGFIDSDGEEKSGGGFHCVYRSDLQIDIKLLLVLATIWFRENSIIDWAEKTKKEILKGGTKAAVAALMGRCMSHNIGSHALYHIEKKESRESEEAVDKHTLRASFYSYLRERMDFVASVATQMPVWTKTMKVKDIIDRIKQNVLLLQNVAKSEGVDNILIEYKGGALEVAIPGGVIGAQAFYLILENIVRDAAKYGTKSSSTNMNLTVQALELSDQESLMYASELALGLRVDPRALKDELKSNFLKIVVSDDKSFIQSTKKDLDTTDTTDTYKQIDEAIKMIESKGLCSEKGELLPGNWGIKERYIASIFLRGESPEDILLGSIKQCLFPPILRPENHDGKLTWIFCLLKPKEALVIKDRINQNALHEKNRQKVEVRDWNWLHRAINYNSPHLRSQFVVLYPNTQENIKILQESLPHLSYRIIICSHDCRNDSLKELNQKHCFTDDLSLDQEDLLLELRRKWVNFLLGRKRLRGKLRVNFYRECTRECWRNWLVCENGNLFMDNGDDGFRVVIDRHATNKYKYFPLPEDNEGGIRMLGQNVIHYEPHDGGFSVEQIETALQYENDIQRKKELILGVVEAATISLLVIDERLDEDIDKMPQESDLNIKFRDLLSAKGITIKGKEYANKSTVPSPNSLIEWAKSDNRFSFEKNNKPYDFVLLHQGVIDKLHKHYGGTKKKVDFTEDLIEKIKEQGVWDVIVHSGRGPQELPERVKFLGLSNVEAWIMQHASKCDIIQELMALRIRK